MSNKQTFQLHLPHFEELPFLEKDLVRGIEKIEYVYQQLSDKFLKDFNAARFNLKIDGSPMVMFGVDPRPKYKGQFFVATKAGLSKTNPRICHSYKEIGEKYEGHPGLIEKLSIAFFNLKPYFKQYKGVIFQSDYLFDENILSASTNTYFQNMAYVFKPNVLTYVYYGLGGKHGTFNAHQPHEFGLALHNCFNIESSENGEYLLTKNNNDEIMQQVMEQSLNFPFFLKHTFVDKFYPPLVDNPDFPINDKYVFCKNMKSVFEGPLEEKRNKLFQFLKNQKNRINEFNNLNIKKVILYYLNLKCGDLEITNSSIDNILQDIKEHVKYCFKSQKKMDQILYFINDNQMFMEEIALFIQYLISDKSKILTGSTDYINYFLCGYCYYSDPTNTDDTVTLRTGEGLAVVLPDNTQFKFVDKDDFTKIHRLNKQAIIKQLT